VYVVRNPAGIVLYVGRTDSLRERMHAHKRRSLWWASDLVITWEREVGNLEAILIDKLRPVYNQINWDIWLERGDELWKLTVEGHTRQEIRDLTGVPNATLTRVLYPYWQSARRAHGGPIRQDQLKALA
jgi:hypothetical protein